MLIQESITDFIAEIKLQINETNSFTPDGFAALEGALTKMAADNSVRVLILSSARPDFFSNGLDPHSVHGATPEQIQKLISSFFSVLKKIFLFPVPVIAAINGHAVGYGAMLGLMSDFRLLVDKGARVSFLELNIGVSLPIFVTTALEDLVGLRATRDLLFTGLAPKPPEALALGLVDELVEKEKLADRARALGKKIASLPKNATRAQKGIIRHRFAQNLDRILEEDIKQTGGLLNSPEAREGFAAMVEKRRPKFD
ncbi:MAG TPA: enoyl-CoA hydratase/isomerase family protein [Leptospiraceae bacterium]|nr:enoyl-CoA hydratase/isomerase family protein [Leptospiraceae bacterium]